MPTSPIGVLTIYLAALGSMIAAVQLRAENSDPIRPADRGAARGWIETGIPRLDPDDPMANAAMLMSTLATIGVPDLDSAGCRYPARSFTLLLDGRLSRVRFSRRAVCQLKRLKYISAAQPGFGRRGLGEVAAFILGKRMGAEIDVGRIVVPPFRFTRDTVTFESADLGPLEPNEAFIGTYHTHPDGDLEEGVLSAVDLAFLQRGYVDFHGRVGRLSTSADGVDWLFDIVEPRDGDWNVYAHDALRLAELDSICKATPRNCPVEELRLAGSRFYLLSRYNEQ